jgi:hypothetical protein
VRILEELVELIGWYRGADDHQASAGKDARLRTRAELLLALIGCWAVLEGPAGKLLAPCFLFWCPCCASEQELMSTMNSPAAGPHEHGDN